jgi:hypothetical protein
VFTQLNTPIFASYRPALGGLTADNSWPKCDVLNQLAGARNVRNRAGLPIRFVPPNTDGSAMAYEQQIAQTGEIPTREMLHDVFNAFQWISFPQLKSAINAGHVSRLAAGGLDEAKSRSTARDVLTMFDESGVIVSSADASLLALMRDFQWKKLFVERRDDVVAHMHFLVVGHGLMEKALSPFIGITGKAILLEMDASTFRDVSTLDQRAAAWLDDPANLVSATTLAPLPLLGVPGWDARNAAPDFYDNVDYFRPGRLRQQTQAKMPA